ncbi:hypothetical protein [Natroniella sp. ANB-PHB2]|uniref:hypothetical protein n=1 Tax=Natroniella sp. ANB-PHB2 TaxID=3384444 RepID=UPI0038D43BDB
MESFIQLGSKIKRIVKGKFNSGPNLKGSSNLSVLPKVNVDILAVNTKTDQIVSHQRTHNLALRDGRNLIRDFLDNEEVTGLTTFALGTGDKEEEDTDEELENEVFADQITKTTKDTGKLTCIYYLRAEDANNNDLKEAILRTDQGRVYARVVFNEAIEKNDSIAVTFTWELTWVVV